MSTNTPNCPYCDATVELPEDVMANELVSCADCGTELDVISLNPLELDAAPEVEEDWGE